LAFEADAAFGYLVGCVRFHPVDPDIRGAVGANVPWPTHLKFTLVPAAFLQMTARLPDFELLPELQLPGNAALFGLAALLEEALEKLARARRGSIISISRPSSP